MKIVLADLDGTLLYNDRKQIPERNLKAIEALWRQGYLFGLASGRPLDELYPRKDAWGLSRDFDVLIGMNGSELWDGLQKKEFTYFKMKREWLKETLVLMSRFENQAFIYKDHKIVTNVGDKTMLATAKRANKEMVVVPTEELYADENAKILFRVKEEQMAAIEDYVAKHPNPNYAGYKTQKTLFEFSDKRITKSYAMNCFCTMNRIDPGACIMFGDTTNDISLLRYCGLGVCMCNGSEDAKAAADAITDVDNEHAGFADYVFQHIL